MWCCMKLKKKFVVLFLLFIITGFSILVLSIFSINVIYAKEIVTIENIEIEEKSENTITSVPSYDGLSVDTNITFQDVGDYVKYKITIKNNDKENNYKIKEIKDNNESEYITYEYSYKNKQVKQI